MCLIVWWVTVLRITDSPSSREIICSYVLLAAIVANRMGFETIEQITGELETFPSYVLSKLHDVIFTFLFTAT
jgi:hypothetical protein